MKTVYKPWGREEWLEKNARYCYKRIYINAGTRTSFQYHNHKMETNYIISGEAEIWLENEEGAVEKKIMTSGEFFTVLPPRKHRVVAITDIVLQEASTPEVDDVIRIEDDEGRESGRIEQEHMKPALCILTAGTGSRMKSLSDHNKGLFPLGNKAIISHMIEKTPHSYDIVVVLGYRGWMVREYCEAAHPDRSFTFVEVDKYEGDGTGPGYSIKQAREYLQRPFIWTTSDTVVPDPLPDISCNWLGLHPTSMPELYSTAHINEDNQVSGFKNKAPDGHDYAFIGLAGVYDYEVFWNALDTDDSEIVSAYYDTDKYPSLKPVLFDWYDIGTVETYLKAKHVFEDSVELGIPKTNGEVSYVIGDRFVKMSSDEDFIHGRIDRAVNLEGLTPPLTYHGNSLYAYKWIDGATLYDTDSIEAWTDFLVFLTDNMWVPCGAGDEHMRSLCLSFYQRKTWERLYMFLGARGEEYSGEHVVNGVHTESVGDLLGKLDWGMICKGHPTKLFHGDLQFDNAIIGNDDLLPDRRRFYLLDWRQDFAGSHTGDVYYDLSKMYGGILMSYKLVKNEAYFSCRMETDRSVSHDCKHTDQLGEFRPIYEEWLGDQGFDLDKVRMITALIFLNMSPLHERELGDMLFFKSKQMLQEITS